MRKSGVIVILMSLFLSIIIINNGTAQLPVQKKRSQELTKKGISLYKAQKVDDARKNFLKAVDLDRKNVLAHEMLSLVYYQERNFDEATKHAQAAIALNKNSGRAYYILGLISYQAGNEKQAESKLSHSYRLLKDPERRENAKRILENIRKKVKDSRPAIRVRDKIEAIQSDPETHKDESQYKPYIAVFQFEDANVKTKELGVGETLTEMLVTALIKSNRFNVMERVQLQKIMGEQSLSQTGAVDTETAIQVGKLAGLEAVVVGSVSKLKSAIEGDARLIEVETGKALAATNGKVNDVDDIRSLADELAKKLSLNANLIIPKTDSTKVEY